MQEYKKEYAERKFGGVEEYKCVFIAIFNNK